MSIINSRAHLLGDEINTDVHCSSKYLPGRDTAYIAQRAFEQVAPGFAERFEPGDIIVAGRNFGINSSREQAVHVMRMMGVAAIVAVSFGRQFFRNAINNGLPVVECDIAGIAENDDVAVDLENGRIAVAARGQDRANFLRQLRHTALDAAGGLIPFLKQHPQWELA